MNMKDAFRFQNKLQTLMGTAQDILSSSRNITKVENTYLRKKVMPEAEDEVTVDQPTSEYSEQITCVAEFLLYLMTEKEKLGSRHLPGKGHSRPAGWSRRRDWTQQHTSGTGRSVPPHDRGA